MSIVFYICSPHIDKSKITVNINKPIAPDSSRIAKTLIQFACLNKTESITKTKPQDIIWPSLNSPLEINTKIIIQNTPKIYHIRAFSEFTFIKKSNFNHLFVMCTLISITKFQLPSSLLTQLHFLLL